MVHLGIAEADGRCWVTVAGKLDRYSSEWFRQQLVALGKRGCRQMLIDLRPTTFIDSSGLNVLLGVMEGVDDLGGQLVLRAPPGDVYELGRVRRLGELLAVVDDAVDEAEAIDRLSALFASRAPERPIPDVVRWVFDGAEHERPSRPAERWREGKA
jgi:anti-anti-sigma factor